MNFLQYLIWSKFKSGGRPILEALIRAFCANDEFLMSRVRMEKVVLKTEKYISELPFFFFFAFKAVLYVMEYAVPPIAFKFRRFTRMPLEKQCAYLETWEHSRFAYKRNVFILMKACLVCQVLSEHKVLSALGYGQALEDRIGRRHSLPGLDNAKETS